MGLLRIFLKTTVFSGAVYYTVQQGVWSDQDDSVKVYTRVYDTFAPHLRQTVPQEVLHEVDKIPSSGDLKNYILKYWNMGIIASIGFVSDLPTHVSSGARSVSDTVQKLIVEEK